MSYTSLTKYKSNYTSTIYMKVITSLCNEDANQREEHGSHGDFSPEVHVLANTLVPVVSIAHLMVRRLIGITRQACTSGTARTYPESEGSSMTRSTRVALCDPRGVSTILLTNPPSKHRTIYSRASTESQATKTFRRWQPLRVTSTTGLQLNHLMSLDATL